MTTDHGVDSDRPLPAVFAVAVDAAGYAPSVHNTQPWRWRIGPDTLALHADRGRQLTVADPDGRLLTISCGASLHQARTALAAQGYRPAVTRLPDPAGPDLLATITVTGRIPVTPEAVRHFQSSLVRHTDRRPVSDNVVPADAIEALRAAAVAEQTELQILPSEQITELATAVARAEQFGMADSARRAEMAHWVGGARPEGSGMPDTVIPSSRPQTTVPARDFGHAGTLPIGPGHDRGAVYGILFGTGDEPADWLRAGEALSACWLAAIEHELSIVPISSVVEISATRELLRRALADVGHPYLVLRIGFADAVRPGPPHPPRRPAG